LCPAGWSRAVLERLSARAGIRCHRDRPDHGDPDAHPPACPEPMGLVGGCWTLSAGHGAGRQLSRLYLLCWFFLGRRLLELCALYGRVQFLLDRRAASV